MAEQTGLCTLAVNYENDAFVGTCCTTVPGNPDGPQDPTCHAAVLGSKAFANPVTFTCLDGSRHSVEPFQSILGRTTKALADLGMSNYLKGSGGESVVYWSKPR